MPKNLHLSDLVFCHGHSDGHSIPERFPSGPLPIPDVPNDRVEPEVINPYGTLRQAPVIAQMTILTTAINAPTNGTIKISSAPDNFSISILEMERANEFKATLGKLTEQHQLAQTQ